MRGKKTAALALVITSLLVASPAAASSAQDLVQSAKQLEQTHQEDLALRRYMDALSLDPLLAEAYLGLGSLRARRGDLAEAERVYDVALERMPGLTEARLARAGVRRSRGETKAAIADLFDAEDEVSALKTIAKWQGEDGQTPAQLATWRKLLARAEATNDGPLLKEARVVVRALVILVGPADPAAAPTTGRLERRVLANAAKRGP